MELEWAIVERIAPAFMAAIGLGWWLSGRFKKVEDTAKGVELAAVKMMSDHEFRDQFRHEQNLTRFEKISVALAKLGYSNGTA